MIDLSVLVTESRNKETMGLDQMTPLEIVTVMNREDGKAVEAIGEVLPQIAQAIAWCTDSLKQKGRIIYIGEVPAEGWECWMRWNVLPPSGCRRTWWWA